MQGSSNPSMATSKATSGLKSRVRHLINAASHNKGRRPSNRNGVIFPEGYGCPSSSSLASFSSTSSFSSSSSRSSAGNSVMSDEQAHREGIERFIFAYGYFTEDMDRESREILTERVHAALTLESSSTIEVLCDVDDVGLASLPAKLREDLESLILGVCKC